TEDGGVSARAGVLVRPTGVLAAEEVFAVSAEAALAEAGLHGGFRREWESVAPLDNVAGCYYY
ncbi:MAG: hypothetical protein LBC67_07780, partial [Spirochaetales bacterium]|nr:hypothetical protein [Spirochaetales bacterium]